MKLEKVLISVNVLLVTPAVYDAVKQKASKNIPVFNVFDRIDPMSLKIIQTREKIKRLPLKEILRSKYGMEFNSSGMTLCPFHDDTKPSLNVSRVKNEFWRWHCFGCDKGGDLIDSLSEKEGLDFNYAVEQIISENNLEVEAKKSSSENADKN